LIVGWGHESVLPAVVARDHGLASTMLASSLPWQAFTAVAAYLVLVIVCVRLGYSADMQWAWRSWR
jgi:hypothetical protein